MTDLLDNIRANVEEGGLLVGLGQKVVESRFSVLVFESSFIFVSIVSVEWTVIIGQTPITTIMELVRFTEILQCID